MVVAGLRVRDYTETGLVRFTSEGVASRSVSVTAGHCGICFVAVVTRR